MSIQIYDKIHEEIVEEKSDNNIMNVKEIKDIVTKHKERLELELDTKWKHRYLDIESYIDKKIRENYLTLWVPIDIDDLNNDLSLSGKYFYIFNKNLSSDDKNFIANYIKHLYTEKGFKIEVKKHITTLDTYIVIYIKWD